MSLIIAINEQLNTQNSDSITTFLLLFPVLVAAIPSKASVYAASARWCAGLPIRWFAKNVGWRGVDFLRTPPWCFDGRGAAHTHPLTSPTQFQEIRWDTLTTSKSSKSTQRNVNGVKKLQRTADAIIDVMSARRRENQWTMKNQTPSSSGVAPAVGTPAFNLWSINDF